MHNEELTRQFIAEHREEDVRQLALKQKQYPDVDIAFALQQIAGWQKAKNKLPEIAAIAEWHYPALLSLEQCSSELTARHKAILLSSFIKREATSLSAQASSLSKASLVDLTGGMGVDTLYMSDIFEHTIYVERQPELCSLARHNFPLAGREIEVVEADAEEYLKTMPHADCIYCDPARRSAHGGKVFRLSDCEPDLTRLYPTLASKADILLFKLSPMLDLSEALRTLTDAVQADIVAVRGEVKELLIVCIPSLSAQRIIKPQVSSLSAQRIIKPQALPLSAQRIIKPQASSVIRCFNLGTAQPAFCYTSNDDRQAACLFADSLCRYLYEPNAALMKAGCFSVISERYGIAQLARDSHLFTSDTLISDFPGRVFEVDGLADKHSLNGQAYSVISRNHPLTADQLRQRHRLRESDTRFLIATRITSASGKDTPVLICANRINL